LSKPILQVMREGHLFNWDLFLIPVPPTIVVDGDELFGDAALYWHNIAISSDRYLNSADGKQCVEARSEEMEGHCHSEALKQLFHEYWSVADQDPRSPPYQWKMYCILIFASSIIERMLFDIYHDSCREQQQSVSPPLSIRTHPNPLSASHATHSAGAEPGPGARGRPAPAHPPRAAQHTPDDPGPPPR
jgi:hypothetical protein